MTNGAISIEIAPFCLLIRFCEYALRFIFL